jgi:prepilin-type processing-associated H-X9-DG protein
MMEAADSLAVDINFDHVHAWEWFAVHRATPEARLAAIENEVATKRHSHTGANYLYADGHVETIAADQIAAWAAENFNFARPPR